MKERIAGRKEVHSARPRCSKVQPLISQAVHQRTEGEDVRFTVNALNCTPE